MKLLHSGSRAMLKVAGTASLVVVLSACAPTPTQTSRMPNQTADQTWKDGLFSQPLVWERTRPGCSGECPSIKIQSLIFPGVPQLTQRIDRSLAQLTSIPSETQPQYDTLEQFQNYYWSAAGPRDATFASATIRYASKAFTVIELGTWQYYTGAAHGNTATRFLNWDNARKTQLALDDILLSGAYPAYVKALQKVHYDWMRKHPDAEHDMQAFERQWPFQASKNVALTDAGLLIKYNSYEIAPYSSGQPELLVPYTVLKGIVHPDYLPVGM